MVHRILRLASYLMIAHLGTGQAFATEPTSCATVRMSDPGWSDISATNALVGAVLKGLGYKPHVDLLAVPVTYRSVSDSKIDVFLGNWMPAQAKFIDPLKQDGKAEIVDENLKNIRFTLAVPSYVADAGVHNIEDLSKFGGKFDHKIYGIESGAPVNMNIRAAIKAGDYGWSDWDVVESGEQAMLAQVNRAVRRHQWIAFVAWEPHPMNTMFRLTYLSGGVKTFGDNYGSSNVFTITRKGYSKACPNLGRLFAQVSFSIAMENEIMAKVAGGETADAAALTWLKAHPHAVEPWLKGVTTFDGHEGLTAVRAGLGLD